MISIDLKNFTKQAKQRSSLASEREVVHSVIGKRASADQSVT